jgi:hypothetical protein
MVVNAIVGMGLPMEAAQRRTAMLGVICLAMAMLSKNVAAPID